MKPPLEIPKEMYNEYTMNDTIKTGNWYRDDTEIHKQQEYSFYSKQKIDYFIECIRNISQ